MWRAAEPPPDDGVGGTSFLRRRSTSNPGAPRRPLDLAHNAPGAAGVPRATQQSVSRAAPPTDVAARFERTKRPRRSLSPPLPPGSARVRPRANKTQVFQAICLTLTAAPPSAHLRPYIDAPVIYRARRRLVRSATRVKRRDAAKNREGGGPRDDRAVLLALRRLQDDDRRDLSYDAFERGLDLYGVRRDGRSPRPSTRCMWARPRRGDAGPWPSRPSRGASPTAASCARGSGRPLGRSAARPSSSRRIATPPGGRRKQVRRPA